MGNTYPHVSTCECLRRTREVLRHLQPDCRLHVAVTVVPREAHFMPDATDVWDRRHLGQLVALRRALNS